MVMNSRFPGKCIDCKCPFPVGEPINYVRGVGARHASPVACNNAKAARAPLAQTPQINLTPIADFLLSAQKRGLKNPKLRVLAPDGSTELRLSTTSPRSAVPGSIAVVLGADFVGCVRPNGDTTGRFAMDSVLQNHLLEVAKNPVQAAQKYAALMGLCSFCGKQLTDEGSTEVGYGPVCAKHWGLPHQPKGTPHLGKVPSVQQNLIGGSL